MNEYQKLAEQMQGQIGQWQSQVEKMLGLEGPMDETMKNQMASQMEQMNAAMKEAQNKLGELQEANVSAIKDLESTGQDIFDSWLKGWQKAMSHYLK